MDLIWEDEASKLGELDEEDAARIVREQTLSKMYVLRHEWSFWYVLTNSQLDRIKGTDDLDILQDHSNGACFPGTRQQPRKEN